MKSKRMKPGRQYFTITIILGAIKDPSLLTGDAYENPVKFF